MRRNKKGQEQYLSRKKWNDYLRSVKRELKKRNKRKGDYLSLVNAKKSSENTGSFYISPQKKNLVTKTKTPFRKNTRHILSRPASFSKEKVSHRDDGYILIPSFFSLTENPKESYRVLKRLLFLLYTSPVSKITLDYKDCIEIALDASVCMDVLILEYVHYLRNCKQNRESPRIKTISPVHFDRPEIAKILFSIGAFKNIKGWNIEFEDILTYNLCISSEEKKRDAGLDITELVDYVIKCLEKMHMTLSPDARNNLCRVIGEILINAEEHSTTHHRYSIGYFQEKNKEGVHIGIFNLVILNFGDSIYEKFSSPDCPNQDIVTRMQELSALYSSKNFFGKAKFEEETLWTLYALQEGVTSVSRKKFPKRGNGSIRFIESFFNLTGSGIKMDNVSKLTLLSGNTKIIFDGKYEIKDRKKGNHTFKIMAFNTSGNIEEQPDKKYVSFIDHYFPGTLLAAKILINDNDLELSTLS